MEHLVAKIPTHAVDTCKALNGATALALASLEGHEQVVSVLLRAKADANWRMAGVYAACGPRTVVLMEEDGTRHPGMAMVMMVMTVAMEDGVRLSKHQNCQCGSDSEQGRGGRWLC